MGRECGRGALRAILGAGAVGAAVTAGCAPPPYIDVNGGGGGPEGPTLEITYPAPDQQIELDDTCVLTEPIVVYVTGIELVEPNGKDIPGQGHWHGGPDLSNGYCLADRPFCEGAASAGDYEEYDGSGMRPGLITLYASLQSNLHADLGVEDQVEVQLVDPGDHCSGVTGS